LNGKQALASPWRCFQIFVQSRVATPETAAEENGANIKRLSEPRCPLCGPEL
jgi:hypothetical protein